MGGESSSSSVESGGEGGGGGKMGIQTEMIRIPGAQLCLIDGEESVHMQSGDFALSLLKQTHSPLAVVVANVGEVQWPVGKDAPVLKVWTRRYTFSLPGLVYGLILPDTTANIVLQQLENILARYCAFQIHHEIANSEQHQIMATSAAGDDTKYWTAVAPEVENISSRVARQIGSTSTIVADSIMMGGDWAALGIKQGGALLKRKGPDTPVSDGGVSPRMMKRMQQARRMSAVAKVVSRTLLKGTISATGHVSRTLGLDVNTPSDETSMRNVAVASVDAFGKVVEAVETAGKSLYGVTRSVGTDIAQERFGSQAGQVLQDGLSSVGNVINTAWTLNKMGVKMLLRVAAASTALNLRSGSAQVTPINSPSKIEQPTNSSPVSSVTSSAPLQHQITLSPPQHLQNLHDAAVPLNLLPPANYGHNHHHNPQPLQTSQLFPTTAGQLRGSNSHVGLPSGSLFNPFMPAGNYTTSIPPGPRPNSPFQQYHRAMPQQSHQAPFSFPYDDKN